MCKSVVRRIPERRLTVRRRRLYSHDGLIADLVGQGIRLVSEPNLHGWFWNRQMAECHCLQTAPSYSSVLHAVELVSQMHDGMKS